MDSGISSVMFVINKLKAEDKQLCERLKALNTFLDNPIAVSPLPQEHMRLLLLQQSIMEAYTLVLNARIVLLTKTVKGNGK